jgi:hypothetical protein
MQRKFCCAGALLTLIVTMSVAQDRDIAVESVAGKKFAFLVGVTEYENSDNFPTLTYTVINAMKNFHRKNNYETT